MVLRDIDETKWLLLVGFRRPLAKPGVAVVLDFDPRIPDVLYGDPTRLRQVLSNLVRLLSSVVCSCVMASLGGSLSPVL